MPAAEVAGTRSAVPPRGAARDAFVAFALRRFGAGARRAAARKPRLRHALEQAHLPLLPDAYVALTRCVTLTVACAGTAAVAAFLAARVALGYGAPQLPLVLALVAAPTALAGLVACALSAYPEYRAGERRRGIEQDVAPAVNHTSALTSAGLIPVDVFRELAREPLYGEVSREMAWLVRDVDVLGLDLVTAIDRAIDRTPSLRLEEFLQGAKTTLLAGGDLRVFFTGKAQQYLAENRQLQKSFLDTLGVLAESYVTVVIAGPLFLLVLFSMMIVIGNSTGSTLQFLVLLVFLILPAAHLLFTWVVSSVAPEA